MTKISMYGQTYAVVSESPFAKLDGTRKTDYLRRIPRFPASALQFAHCLRFAEYMVSQRGVTGVSHGMPTVAWNAHIKGFGGTSKEAMQNRIRARDERHAVADRHITEMKAQLAVMKAGR